MSPVSLTAHLEQIKRARTHKEGPQGVRLKSGGSLAVTEQRVSNIPARSQGRSPGSEPMFFLRPYGSRDFPLGPLSLWHRQAQAPHSWEVPQTPSQAESEKVRASQGIKARTRRRPQGHEQSRPRAGTGGRWGSSESPIEARQRGAVP